MADLNELDADALRRLRPILGAAGQARVDARLAALEGRGRVDAEPARRRGPRRPPQGPDASFMAAVEGSGLPTPVTEHRFHTVRRWRFDYAWPDHMVALEVEGGVFSGGRHSRGAGFRADAEKYNTAAVMGWTVLRVLPEQLVTAETIDLLRRVLGVEGKTVAPGGPS